VTFTDIITKLLQLTNRDGGAKLIKASKIINAKSANLSDEEKDVCSNYEAAGYSIIDMFEDGIYDSTWAVRPNILLWVQEQAGTIRQGLAKEGICRKESRHF